MRHRLFCAASLVVALPFLVTACNGPRAIHETPIIVTGDRVASADSFIDAARLREADAQRASRERAEVVASRAVSGCAPAVCNAIARGEATIGMTESELLAATRTTESAWRSARLADGVVLTPASADAIPADANGRIERVQLRGDRVASLTRSDRTGIQVVTATSDTSRAAATRALADALVREGDDLIAAGDRARALERYDRALVLRDNDPMLTYKVAQLLDQQLRPQEALMRYQKFLLQLELQRIEAQGTQAAKFAEAIALAQQRVVILERQR